MKVGKKKKQQALGLVTWSGEPLSILLECVSGPDGGGRSGKVSPPPPQPLLCNAHICLHLRHALPRCSGNPPRSLVLLFVRAPASLRSGLCHVNTLRESRGSAGSWSCSSTYRASTRKQSEGDNNNKKEARLQGGRTKTGKWRNAQWNDTAGEA